MIDPISVLGALGIAIGSFGLGFHYANARAISRIARVLAALDRDGSLLGRFDREARRQGLIP